MIVILVGWIKLHPNRQWDIERKSQAADTTKLDTSLAEVGLNVGLAFVAV